jgi:hypothetical protein
VLVAKFEPTATAVTESINTPERVGRLDSTGLELKGEELWLDSDEL